MKSNIAKKVDQNLCRLCHSLSTEGVEISLKGDRVMCHQTFQTMSPALGILLRENRGLLASILCDPNSRLQGTEIEFIERVFDDQKEVGGFIVISAPDVFVKFYSAQFETDSILAPDGATDGQIDSYFSLENGSTMVFRERRFINLKSVPELKYIASLKAAMVIRAHIFEESENKSEQDKKIDKELQHNGFDLIDQRNSLLGYNGGKNEKHSGR